MDVVESEAIANRKQRLALIAVSLAVLMTVLDGTIVYVALPSIGEDLRLQEASLVWVVNAFTLANCGFLLLGGRLGDLYGHRKIFLAGLTIFTAASLICGLSDTLALLVLGRGLQGLGGAVVISVARSLILSMFQGDTERAEALGLYSFICVGGGSVGFLLGGVLTSALSWHWIFLVNLPIGAVVYALCASWLPGTSPPTARGTPDFWGAVTITAALVLAVYALLNGGEVRWISFRCLGLLACAGVSFIAFLVIESRVPNPLMPVKFFNSRSVLVSNTVRILWAAGASASFFIVLYLQLVLGYGPMEAGLAFLPGNLLMAAFSLIFSGKLVVRLGISIPVTIGLALSASGLTVLARVPVGGEVMIHVMPSVILLALSVAVSAVPLLLATTVNVAPRDFGLASGITATVSMMGSALGLAVLVSLSSARANGLLASGVPSVIALTEGYRLAFLSGAASVATAAVLGAIFLPRKLGALPPV